MQSAHEWAERRSLENRAKTEAHQLYETELMMLHGHVNASQLKIQELQEKLTRKEEEMAKWRQEYMGEFLPVAPPPPPPSPEQLELRTIEDQMLGAPRPALSKELLQKIMSDKKDGSPTAEQAHRVRLMAHRFRLTEGRSPSWKEIQRWITSTR